MQSHYGINVSINGKHLFATAERSAVTEREMRALRDFLIVRFPAADGFCVEVTRWEVTGHRIDA